MAAGIALAIVAAAVAGAVLTRSSGPVSAPVEGEAPQALARHLASQQQFSPDEARTPNESPSGFADQDWYERSVDGAENSPPPFEAFATARNDWFGLLARPAVGTGKWEPYGPTHGLNDLNNQFRDRSVYNAGTQNFSGRLVHGAIDPGCTSAECYLWVANAGGGVWRTTNALAAEPQWEFVSHTFEHNSVGALELDPNDKDGNTLWAGTGEPNACGVCEIGVGLYVTKSAKSKSVGTMGWQGPIGAEHFFGRAIGSIEVKPGDSDTIFVATGRGIRGGSNTCCGGADALTPGAPHFGVFRTQDGGKSWELVNQGADALCTASHPDVVSLNGTACSPRGARRIKIDPVDPNTVYASFFARGIWRSKSNGDPGTWEQIMPRVGPSPAVTTERAEFDVVALPNGETRMYVGVGAGGLSARFRRNDDVRSAPAAVVAASWIDLTSQTPDTPGYSSHNYCEPQCWYDNYVYAPAAHAPSSGASPDVVYLLGDNEYSENDWGPLSPFYFQNPGSTSGRSNGRGVLVSTNAGASFFDMTEDATHPTHPGALHPDHHAIVVNPTNWKQFFDLGDGGIVRSSGEFVDDSAICDQPKGYTGTRRTFCELVLSQVPTRLTAINKGLRTMHIYSLGYDPRNPERIAFGTQDNGSWETLGDRETWLNVNIADGGHNSYDAKPGDSNFALTAWQVGQFSVRYDPMDSKDVNWISDTLWSPPYSSESVPFIANGLTDPVTPGWLWTGREHVFRSTNYGRNPAFATKEAHRANCNVWTGAFAAFPCDDWRPLGDPGPSGRLTSPTYGTRAGGNVAHIERAPSDTKTLWAATSTGRIFVSKNADNPNPAAVVFDRIDDDPTATSDPPRYPTSIFVDPQDPNHAWITYSGYNVKTPTTPGHVIEVRYAPQASTFTVLDGHKINGYGDIPAQAIVVSNTGTLYVANDYGVVQKEKNSPVWKHTAAGLPNLMVAELIYVPEKSTLYAGTHGQGVWQLKLQERQNTK